VPDSIIDAQYTFFLFIMPDYSYSLSALLLHLCQASCFI